MAVSDINRVVLVGRLTRDPELKSTSTGSFYCRFTLASNNSIYNRETKESREEVGFFDCVAWGGLAEVISKYVTKGRRVAVDGSLRFSSWEDSEGKKQSKVNVKVDNFQFLESKPQGAGTSYDAGQNVPMSDFPSEMAPPQGSGSDAFGADDVPF